MAKAIDWPMAYLVGPGFCRKMIRLQAMGEAWCETMRNRPAWVIDATTGRVCWPRPRERKSRAFYLMERHWREIEQQRQGRFVGIASKLMLTSRFIVPAGGDLREAWRAAYSFVRDNDVLIAEDIA